MYSFLCFSTEIAPIPVDCDNTTCGNAGSCIQDVTGDIICLCEEGWTGSNCSENINDCTNNPCSNGGTCEDRLNGYICTCPSAWTGTICEEGKHEYYGLHMTNSGCTLPNKSLIMLTHSRKDCST